MSTTIKKDAALNYAKQMCGIIKSDVPSLRMPEINNIKIKKDIDEFYLFFENAVNSSSPFIDNVNKMREQGIWLPEKINDNSVKQNYYNLAKGYFYKVFNNESFTGILMRAGSRQSKEIMDALQRINVFLDSIIKGDIAIE